jgi:hypothetical protein
MHAAGVADECGMRALLESLLQVSEYLNVILLLKITNGLDIQTITEDLTRPANTISDEFYLTPAQGVQIAQMTLPNTA